MNCGVCRREVVYGRLFRRLRNSDGVMDLAPSWSRVMSADDIQSASEMTTDQLVLAVGCLGCGTLLMPEPVLAHGRLQVPKGEIILW